MGMTASRLHFVDTYLCVVGAVDLPELLIRIKTQSETTYIGLRCLLINT